MQIIYTGNEWVLPALLLPSVYLILPLGTLFVTINTNTDANGTRTEDADGLASPRKVAMMSPLKKTHVHRFPSPSLTACSAGGSHPHSIGLDDNTVVEAPSVVIDWAEKAEEEKASPKGKTLEV